MVPVLYTLKIVPQYGASLQIQVTIMCIIFFLFFFFLTVIIVILFHRIVIAECF